MIKRVLATQLLVVLFLCLFVGSASAATIDTIALSNEADGFLIDQLAAQGYGNLYDVLNYLQPYSGGSISTSFMASLAATPSESDAKSAALSNFCDISNNPIGIGSDGSLIVTPIYGHDYISIEGYTTYGQAISGLGTVMFTYANDPAYYIAAGTKTTDVTNYYMATAIVWAVPD